MNPVIMMLEMIEEGCEFEVVDIPKTARKWYWNKDGEYVRDDREREGGDKAADGERGC